MIAKCNAWLKDTREKCIADAMYSMAIDGRWQADFCLKCSQVLEGAIRESKLTYMGEQIGRERASIRGHDAP